MGGVSSFAQGGQVRGRQSSDGAVSGLIQKGSAAAPLILIARPGAAR